MTIAVADALSDALGIHIAEGSKNNGNVLGIWQSTIATFVTKFVIALTFVMPVLLLPLPAATMVSGVEPFFARRAQLFPRPGTAYCIVDSYRGAFVIGVTVIAITHYIGGWIHSTLS